MPSTVRKFWPGPFSGRRVLNFNWDAIESDSVVVITASIYVPQPNPPAGANLQRVDVPFGTVRVDNISPHGPPFDANRGVTFVITVEGGIIPPPMFIATDITVFDDKPVEIQVN
jgi:hypothetical protein